jgi:iron complex outermembrane receptor protein
MFSTRALLKGATALALTVAAGIPVARAAETEPSGKVELVIVTAERRAVDLQKTTLAATVLSGDDLVKKGVYNLTSLQTAAPGITINDYGSANVFNMRGVGREAVDVEIPSGVAIYRDGVPTLAGYFQNEPYYDLDGVEVLRGPQGTFAGQSASGGALFIRSKSPTLDGFSGYVQVGGGEWAEYEAQGAVNVPITDTLALRVSLNYLNRDSWYHLTGTFTGHPGTKDVANARVGIYWQPNASFEFLSKTDIGYLNDGGNPVSTAGAPLFTIQLDDPMAYVDRSIRQVVDMKYHFDGGITLRSLTGIQNIFTVNNLDANGGGPFPPANPLLQADHNSFKSQGNFWFYSQEFDLVSPEDQQLRWVLGLFGERQVSSIPDFLKTGKNGFTFTGFFLGFGADVPIFLSPWHQIEDDLAVFGNVQYDIQPDLTVEAGLRYSYNHKEQFTDFSLGLFGFLNPPTIYIPFGNPVGGSTQHESGDYVDGKIALQWKPTDDDFAYVSASRGHTVKGMNIFPPHDPYKPVEVWNYEVGWKSTILDGHMRTQLDAYYENIGNYQAVFGFTTGGGGGGVINASETRNAETRSRIWGIEASGQGNWGDFSLDFGAAYLNSSIGRFSNVINQFSDVPVGGVPLGNNVAANEARVFGHNCDTESPVVTLTGSKAPFSPEFTGNVGAQYAIHTGAGFTVTPRADVSYVGTNQADLFRCSLETIKAHTLLNLQARLDIDDSAWWAMLWATNVTDEQYVGAIQNIPPIYYAGARRQFGIRIGRSF